MSHIPRIALVGAAALGLAVFSFGAIASAQQPSDDSIDIEYNSTTCRVSIDWEDGTEDTEVLKVSVDAIQRSNVNVNDVVGNQSQILSAFTLEENEDEQRVIAEIYDGERLLDREVRDLLCDPPAPTATAVPPTPTAVPATATPAPTATPIVIEKEVIVQSDSFAFCSDGTIRNLTKGERCAVAPPPVVTQAPAVVVQAPSVGSIRPPSTGDGGLVQPLLPRVFENDICIYCSRLYIPMCNWGAWRGYWCY